MGFMTFVEVLDGYSVDHGFSGEDMAMNALGASFSRAALDGPRPEGETRLPSPVLPLEELEFSAALRLHGAALSLALSSQASRRWSRPPCGISSCRRTTSREASASGKGASPRRDRGLYVGVGLNSARSCSVAAVPLPGRRRHRTGTVFEYLQPPFSALTTDNRR
jgi:hypothetical protein